MPSYLPVFNLQASFWFAGKTPAGDPPDVTDLDVQKYVSSKGLLDLQPGDPGFYFPPIYLRMSVADEGTWASFMIAEVPQGSGSYYLARWKEDIHQGFPNHYLAAICEQCAANGTPTFRHVSI